jgi:cell division protein FtsI (penicillin-binding protein 3)
MSQRDLALGKNGAAALIRFEGVAARAMETARNRLLVAGIAFAMAFLVMAGRLVHLTVFDRAEVSKVAGALHAPSPRRGDIVDRNGVIIATSLPTASLYADPKEVIDPIGSLNRLAAVLPGIDRERLSARLTAAGGRFVWVRRDLTPDEQYAVNRLGLPGFGFVTEERRVYPQGSIAGHVVGLSDIDGRGIAGIEMAFDQTLQRGDRVRLSLDLRVQHMVRQELAEAVREFRAIGAAGVVLDVRTGEILSMVSLPDFDPNIPGEEPADSRFNRVTSGVYEMGSTFKLFTLAMGLDSGVTSLRGGYDASRPIRVGRFTISDYHAKNRWLSVPEILIHSSNIGAAQMAVAVGTSRQRDYLARFGLLQKAAVELPEVGEPLQPAPWREVNTMTVGFGHGVAVSPLQLVTGVAAIVDGGIRRPATLLYRNESQPPLGERVISAATSRQLRALMRMVVRYGTGAKADIPGYRVGGKTGTAEKQASRGYRKDARLASFVAAFPIDEPRYAVLVMVDEPKATAKTFGYATGGWVAAPTVGRLVKRMAPLLGVTPVPEEQLPAEWQMPDPQAGKPVMNAVLQAMTTSRGKQLAAN